RVVRPRPHRPRGAGRAAAARHRRLRRGGHVPAARCARRPRARARAARSRPTPVRGARDDGMASPRRAGGERARSAGSVVMRALMLRFANWLAAKPWIILAAGLLLTLGLGFYAWQIRIESSFESVLPRHDPDVTYYDQIRQTFGSDDVVVVGLRTDDLFAPATLEKVHRVTAALEKLEGVESVLSLTNTPDIAA